MSSTSASKAVSPAWVAICAWLLPGGGYLALGQRARGVTICVSVILLFLLGILIGGIRVTDPPGWGAYGYMTQVTMRRVSSNDWEPLRVEPASAQEEASPLKDQRDQLQGPALFVEPLEELSDKPWFVGQILCGPISLVAAMVSVHEARPVAVAGSAGPDGSPQQYVPMSHARSWEIGTLYTAVAGMLNLLAIIDSTFHMSQSEEE
jgi:hypothetical protein